MGVLSGVTSSVQVYVDIARLLSNEAAKLQHHVRVVRASSGSSIEAGVLGETQVPRRLVQMVYVLVDSRRA